MSLIKKIKDYYKNCSDKKNLLFTTPTHNQGKFIADEARLLLGQKFYKCDFSETEGFDNLREPQNTLKQLLDKISGIYNSKQSFILTNGASSGNISLLLATIKEGEKVLIARNAHISIYNALVLTGAIPVWFTPNFDEDWLIYQGVNSKDIENQFEIHNDIKVVLITSPTYEGVYSDIEGIAKVCKRHNAILIVDEAHGALTNFGNFKAKPAILCGADASVQSLHKTAGAPNPCALIHISKTSSIDAIKVQNSLNIINTTSPSYPLILATEICVDFLNSTKGQALINELLKDIKEFKESLHPNIAVYDGFNDLTKVLVKINNTNSIKVAELLNNDYLIEEEFSTKSAMLFLCGIGTARQKLLKLAKALNEIARKSLKSKNNTMMHFPGYVLPQMKYTPRQAAMKESEIVNLNDAIGKISAETIVEYPPGIPVLIAGEVIDECNKQFINKNKIRVCI